ncbi:ribonuclease HII [Candidatus Parcubacteria bacterium]|nr:ribonuclease HII [Patescibacteria group bacterium]MBU4482383.1 ribonuclease HII [Patescibacteria group bacterium]MCG2686959.1 ribonuclease HII [Candidatus Parcubacteria bacterium]
MRPTNKYENRLRKQGYNFIAGLDEAGRGSWAGPLVSGAVIFQPNVKIKNIKDSKLLSESKRQKMFLYITKNCLTWSVGVVAPQEIDNLGILPANRLAFERAVKRLALKPDYLLIDGLRNLDSAIHNEFVIKGDQKILSIAAASIVAKVVRDSILNNLNKSYPEYNFHQHKGYGTKKHLDAIHKYGPCEIHRFSFKPINML